MTSIKLENLANFAEANLRDRNEYCCWIPTGFWVIREKCKPFNQ